MVLDIAQTCSDQGLGQTLMYIHKIITIIQVIGPIIAIIGLTILLIKMMTNPEDKKAPKQLKNWLIALLVLFFIPMLVNITMGVLGEKLTVSACFNATKTTNGNSSYIDPYKKDRKSIISDSTYEKGDPKQEDNDNTSGIGPGNSNIGTRYFIGDSRTVQMYCYLHGDWRGSTISNLASGLYESNGDVWSSKGSMGLDWMKSTGIPNIESKISSGSAVIILMGVNDLSNIDNYISYINSKASTWKAQGANVYFVSVNPTSGSYSYMNSSINNFNNRIKSISSVKYIDTNSYLQSKGFTATDGLHYDKATYQKIYDHVVSNL
jgi:lysophospholipase L1-like esterase